MKSIFEFDEIVASLYEEDRDSYNIFRGIYEFRSGIGKQKIPKSFRNKIVDYFGQKDSEGQVIEDTSKIIARIEKQNIIHIYNKWTGEGTLFNSFRAKRPGIKDKDHQEEKDYMDKLILESKKQCDFCHPEQYTPEDIFGRIKGRNSVTAANIAKYDEWSSLIIFHNHHPHKFNLEEFSDYLNTASIWFKNVNEVDPSSKFPLFVWNCLPRAGASQIHGHGQILMSREPYGRINILKKACKEYEDETGDNLLHDLYQIHHSLGLATSKDDVFIYTSITPLKEKETIIITTENPLKSIKTKDAIYRILRCYIDILGVYSFNLSISCPEIDKDDFPYIIRIIDRGSLLKTTADMGGMELYASSVVADDPYKVIHMIRNAL